MKALILLGFLCCPSVMAQPVNTSPDLHREMIAALNAYAIYKTGDYEAAFAAWMALAERDNPQGILNVAYLYQSGRGVQADESQAFYWFSRGAAQGDPTALYQVVQAYELGRGVEADAHQAQHFLQQAAAAGSVPAQNRLAQEALLNNDLEQAHYWFQRAADNGDANAMTWLQARRDPLPVDDHPTPSQRVVIQDWLTQLDTAANTKDAEALTASLAPDAVIWLRFPEPAVWQRVDKATLTALWQATFDKSDRYRFNRTHYTLYTTTDGLRVDSEALEYLTLAIARAIRHQARCSTTDGD